MLYLNNVTLINGEIEVINLIFPKNSWRCKSCTFAQTRTEIICEAN